jgi:hypothetical protein
MWTIVVDLPLSRLLSHKLLFNERIDISRPTEKHSEIMGKASTYN